MLGGGHTELTRSQRLQSAQSALRERLTGWSDADFARFVDRHYPAYWIRTDLDVIAEHAELVRSAEQQKSVIVTHISTDAFRGVTPLTLLSPYPPWLLAMVAGA